MKKKLFTAMLMVIFLSPIYPVLAADTPKQIFTQMDTNQDGKVSKEEFMTFYMEYATKIREARFDQLDADGDGKITRKEFMAAQLEEAEKIGKVRFSRIDADRDGVITEEELAKRFLLIKQSLEQLKAE